MHNLLVSFILVVSVISGTSKPLLILAGVLILLFSIGRLPNSGYVVRINHVSTAWGIGFLFFLLLSGIPMPIENVPKFVMTLISAILGALIIGYVSNQTRESQIRIYSFVLVFVLIGDLIHLLGVFGGDMNQYKQLVQFDELSNLDRESEVGILGLRYHGWFAEPSYHGAFTGLLCALLWNKGQRHVFLVACVFFVLCPTPMMVLAFVAGWAMGLQSLIAIIVKHPITAAFIVLLLGVLVSALFASRFVALTSGVAEAIGGEMVNTSEAIRLVYPVMALITHFSSYGFLPESGSCIERATCLPESLKFPLFTYLIFFGVAGVAVISMLLQWLYKSGYVRVFIVIVVASILSGGGGYVLQFGLIVALLLSMSTDGRLPNSSILAKTT